jgi:hypothetical protein
VFGNVNLQILTPGINHRVNPKLKVHPHFIDSRQRPGLFGGQSYFLWNEAIGKLLANIYFGLVVTNFDASVRGAGLERYFSMVRGFGFQEAYWLSLAQVWSTEPELWKMPELWKTVYLSRKKEIYKNIVCFPLWDRILVHF